MTTAIAWFRRDARLDDNPAWAEAARADLVCPLFVLDPSLTSKVSSKRLNLLLAGLSQLDRSLGELGGRLRVERGDPTTVVARVSREVGADQIHVNSEVTPFGTERDEVIARDHELVTHEGNYVSPLGSVLTNDLQPYRVFTPFYKKWIEMTPAPVNRVEPAALTSDSGIGIPDHGQTPVPAGERAGRERLANFMEVADDYHRLNDRIDLDSTSHLSVDLKYGWIGPAKSCRRGRDRVSGKKRIRETGGVA